MNSVVKYLINLLNIKREKEVELTEEKDEDLFPSFETFNSNEESMEIIEEKEEVESKIVIDKYDLKSIILSIQDNEEELRNFNNKYDYSNITDMSFMFSDCKSLKTIPKLNTINVTNMEYMFWNCKSLIDIPELDTKNVTNMKGMFRSCYSLKTIPLLNTLKVTNMKWMFSNCKSLIDIPELNTSKVTNMESMFCDCYSLIDIPELDTKNVTNMESMFRSCYSLIDIPHLDTSNVTDIGFIFCDCKSLISIPELDTSKVEDNCLMFYKCKKLDKSIIKDIENKIEESKRKRKEEIAALEKIEVINIEVINEVVEEETKLTETIEDIENKIRQYKRKRKEETIKESETEDKALNYPKIKSVLEVESELNRRKNKEVENKEDNIVEVEEEINKVELIKEEIELSVSETEEVVKEVFEVKEKIVVSTKKELRDIIFSIQGNKKEIKNFNDKYDYSDITDMSGMFYGCETLIEIPLLYTSKVTNMRGMFSNCKSLKTIPHLNTSNVINMSSMFYRCESLIDIPELNTSKVTNMYFMFCDCYSLETIPLIDTSKVTNISGMFYNCYKLNETIIKNIKEKYNNNKKNIKDEKHKQIKKSLVDLLTSESSNEYRKNNGNWNYSKIKQVLKVDAEVIKRYIKEFETQKEVSNKKISSVKKTYESKPNKIIIENIKSESINSVLNSKTPVELISLYKEGNVSLKELIEYCKNLVKKEDYPFVLELIMKKNYKDMLNEKDMLVIIKEVGKPTIKYIPDSLYKYGNSYEVMVKNMSEKYFKDNERLKVYKDNRVFN
jgi:surface protein